MTMPETLAVALSDILGLSAKENLQILMCWLCFAESSTGLTADTQTQSFDDGK